MLIEVKVPVFSESVTEGTLINWLKNRENMSNAVKT